MAPRHLTLLSLLLVVVGATWANFVPDTTGLYERRGEVKYSVEYYQQFTSKGTKEQSLVAAKKSALFSSPDTYTIRGINGHDYVCFLPEVAEETEQAADTTMKAGPLLAPLNSVCIYRLEGWWTYELCPGKQIRQYHKNTDGKIEAEFSLGAFTNEEGIEEPEYFSSRYDSGTPCDVRSLKRSTVVRYRCETPLLCKHPKYRKKTKQVHPIRCLQIVEVDESTPTGSYSTEIRPIPSPLRDTEFIFREQTSQQQQQAAAEDAANILRASTPIFKTPQQGQPPKPGQPAAPVPPPATDQKKGIRFTNLKVVDPDQTVPDAEEDDDETENVPRTKTSLNSDAARQQLQEQLSRLDQGTMSIEQLKDAIRNMPGFEHLQDVELQILDDAHMSEEDLARFAGAGIDIVASESEPLEIPDDDDDEEQNRS